VLDNSKTKKEGVSRTYQGYDGYHPIFAYLGKEGYMLDCELRPGSQHCQKGTAEFIKGLLERLEGMKGGKRYLFRLGSGNDAWDTLKAVGDRGKGNYCIIKRNRRKERDEMWLGRAKRHGKRVACRKGKKIWIGSVRIHPKKDGERLGEVYCVFEVTERKIDRDGNRLLIPEIEVNSWWTNLDCEPEKVIELYHKHGTSEQFHSELKRDMEVERLPSGKFEVNRIVLGASRPSVCVAAIVLKPLLHIVLYRSSLRKSEPRYTREKSALYRFKYFVPKPRALLFLSLMKLWQRWI
jgi:hypothetical protein